MNLGVQILINAMTPPAYIPLANGLAQSAVSLARFIGPLSGGIIWSSSIKDGPEVSLVPHCTAVFQLKTRLVGSRTQMLILQMSRPAGLLYWFRCLRSSVLHRSAAFFLPPLAGCCQSSARRRSFSRDTVDVPSNDNVESCPAYRRICISAQFSSAIHAYCQYR